MQVLMQLHPSGTALIPAGDMEAQALDRLRGLGGSFRVTIRQTRHSQFHRKGMALFRFLHQQWEPQDFTSDGVPVQRDFKSFRKHLLILAGYYTQVFNGNGSFTLEAKSMNFDTMDNVEFNEVYGRVIEVGVRLIDGCRGMSPEQVDIAVDRIVAFAS